MSNPWQLELDRETFLARHWQKQPLLIRNAIPGFQAPVDADEIAGLAMEAEIESRIVEHRDGDWLLHHGPFTEHDFRRDSLWTLLVQAVDHHVPEVARLRQLFDFIPQWRFDDIMVSYAVDGGSVGPHYDNYDVFLLQTQGQREWRLGQYCPPGSELLPHAELRILADFKQSESYVLEPGDMLYVPPRLAHWGIARGECTTWSFGFRAPRASDMVSLWVDRLLEQAGTDDYFHDANREPATRPGEISARDLERAIAQLQGALDQYEETRWFGELVTEPRYYPNFDEDNFTEAREELQRGGCQVMLDEGGRVAWQHINGAVTVFANGDSRDFDDSVLPAVEQLCATMTLDLPRQESGTADEALQAVLGYLLERGCIYVE
ncbi:MAG: JmjC domain-containing protein [Halioglobus sp.]